MIQNFKILFFLFIAFNGVSCKSETEKVAEKVISRQAIIDSTVIQFQKKFLSKEIDSVFAKYHFNGSVGVFQGENVLYRKDHGFENFGTKTKLDSNSVFVKIGRAHV